MQTRRAEARAEPAPDPATAIDPVCGMSVAMVPSSLSADVDGTTVWFCGPGCRTAYLADPAAYAAAS